MHEWAYSFMANSTLQFREVAQGNRVLKPSRLYIGCDGCDLIQYRVTGVAVVADDLPGIALVLTVVAAETALRIEVAYVVRVSLPVGLHLREEIGLVDALDFTDRHFDGVSLLCVNIRVASAVKTIKARGNRAYSFVVRCVRLCENFNRLPLEIRQRDIQPPRRERVVYSHIRRQVDVGRT
ncbi:MAG: hypothetical protein QOJ02_2518, partial [Acidobacteriota bacterium]|nr:hypothetical protein [Acidobacteriota bacterium]